MNILHSVIFLQKCHRKCSRKPEKLNSLLKSAETNITVLDQVLIICQNDKYRRPLNYQVNLFSDKDS